MVDSPRQITDKIPYTDAHLNFTMNKDAYFDEIGRGFSWLKPYTRLYDFKEPFYNWFPDGEINAAYCCLDAHI